MLRNYLIAAWRNLLRNKVHSFINVFGLALAIGCCLLIALFVWREATFDTLHDKADRIYRLYEVDEGSMFGSIRDQVNLAVGPALKEEHAGIEQIVRMRMERERIEHEGRSVTERWLFADTEILDVFSFPLEQGDSARALDGTYSVVLTAAVAERYFGGEEALGKGLSLEFDEEFYDFTVTGIARDIPENSSVRFDLLFAFDTAEEVGVWGMRNTYRWRRGQKEAISKSICPSLRSGN